MMFVHGSSKACGLLLVLSMAFLGGCGGDDGGGSQTGGTSGNAGTAGTAGTGGGRRFAMPLPRKANSGPPARIKKLAARTLAV
ncbi:MAG: hypothetical protein R3A47_07285 [Polyangiales bacterium]